MAPSEQAGHPKMLLKSPSKPSLAGLSRAKMSKAQLTKGEDFKRNPDVQEGQPARIGSRKGSSARLHLNNEVAKVGKLTLTKEFFCIENKRNHLKG